eukprot:8499603-Pyramimonas_sp.AAC.1
MARRAQLPRRFSDVSNMWFGILGGPRIQPERAQRRRGKVLNGLRKASPEAGWKRVSSPMA